jgi:hypothetical protein
MSRAKYAKEMGSISSDMQKYAKDHEFEPGATERSAVLSEMADRDSFFGSTNYLGGDSSEWGKTLSPVLRKTAALSFLQNMASVGHLMTHMTHQFITTELVAAKYGGWGSVGEAARLHGILGGGFIRSIGSSLAETIRVITKDSKGLNYVDTLVDRLVKGKPKYGAELQALMDELKNTNYIHPDQGFDSAMYHMNVKGTDKLLDKLDRASRQTMGAVEAYNRVWGSALAYIRAREAGESVAEATRSAKDMVSRSQGLLSRSNMSPIMSKWYMRNPMQFRGWGANMMFTIANSIYNAFKGDTPAVKAEAWRRIAYLFGTTAALTGVNGLPSDPMRIALALAGALGITNYNWSDAQNEIRKKAADIGGSGFANLLMDGIFGSMGPFSFYGGDRVGFGSLAVFGEPQDDQPNSLKGWAWNIMMGAPGATAERIGRGAYQLLSGDIADGASNIIPIKIVDDWVKAWKGATVGQPTNTGVPGLAPYGPGETIMQGMGLTPAVKERWREARQAEFRAEKQVKDETTQLLNAVGQSHAGPERLKALQAISHYNSEHPEARITPHDVINAVRRQMRPSALGKTITPKTKARLEELQSAYGLGG